MKSRLKKLGVNLLLVAAFAVVAWWMRLPPPVKMVRKRVANGIVDTLAVIDGDTVFVKSDGELIRGSERTKFPF